MPRFDKRSSNILQQLRTRKENFNLCSRRVWSAVEKRVPPKKPPSLPPGYIFYLSLMHTSANETTWKSPHRPCYTVSARARNSSICSRGAIRGPIKTIARRSRCLRFHYIELYLVPDKGIVLTRSLGGEKRLISHGRNYHTYGKKRINRVNQLRASTSITQRVFFALHPIIRNGNNSNNNGNNDNNNNVGRARNDGAVTRRHYARFTGGDAFKFRSFMLFRFWNGLIEWPSLRFLVKRGCIGSSVDLCVIGCFSPPLFCLYLSRGIWISVFYSCLYSIY